MIIINNRIKIIKEEIINTIITNIINNLIKTMITKRTTSLKIKTQGKTDLDWTVTTSLP